MRVLKYLFILDFLFITCCLTQVGYGQQQLVHPYIGASFNILGVHNAGLGINAGVKYSFFYAGVEYGYYSSSNTADYPGPYQRWPSNTENYYGAHGGVVINNKVYFGLIFLHSYEYSEDGEALYGSWFNVGPDVRVQAMSHLMLAIAYTIRRGFNLGANYLF
jgi:hypothetical protein